MEFAVVPEDAKDFLEKLTAKDFAQIILFADGTPPERGILHREMKLKIAAKTWKRHITIGPETRILFERFTVAKPIPQNVLELTKKSKERKKIYNSVTFRSENLTALFIIAAAAKSSDTPLRKVLKTVLELENSEKARMKEEQKQKRYRMPLNFTSVDRLIASFNDIDELTEKSLENLRSTSWTKSVLQQASSEIIGTAAPNRTTPAPDKAPKAKRQKNNQSRTSGRPQRSRRSVILDNQ